MSAASFDHHNAAQRRAAIRDRAKSIGIDETYISLLVDTFYERVRAHGLLGPIFERAMAGHWEAHLTSMKLFWASVALNTGAYSGKPVPAHQKHADEIKPLHFGIWLGLFAQTLKDTEPSPEATDYLMERAERIARSLRYALFQWDEIEPNGAPRS